MAAWTDSLTLTDTVGVSSLLDGVGTLAGAADAALGTAGGALNAAKVFLAGASSPQAAAASVLVAQAQGIVGDLFGAGFFQLVVHPWTPGVGRGTGPFRHLPFPRCVQVMADSFADQGDAGRPQFSGLAPVELMAIVAGAPSPVIFKATLEALDALLSARELRLALRRLDQAFELEAQRFGAGQGSVPPDWSSVTVREALPALAPLEDALREALAMVEGYAAGGESAVAIAADLIAAKQAQLTALQAKLAAAAALFGGGIEGAGVYALHVEGAGGNPLLQGELTTAANAPGPELAFCAGVCWVAPQGGLASLAAFLGV